MDITKQYWGRTRDITIVNKTLYTMDGTKHITRDITWHIVPGHYKHENESTIRLDRRTDGQYTCC